MAPHVRVTLVLPIGVAKYLAGDAVRRGYCSRRGEVSERELSRVVSRIVSTQALSRKRHLKRGSEPDERRA